ncbi:MAG TPA: cysteine desulfurase, partial [Candidatus Thermoplasmatota archaeon]|nr:cysteine desulfurase [Candidatus Thermoplasmatota archaeon]
YLDNAATTQKPSVVIDTERRYYEELNANVHRGVHHLSEAATKAYEGARTVARRFLNGREDAELIWTRGTTESLNLVAHGLAASLRPGDNILVTGLEHHSNIVPWQMAAARTGATLRHAPLLDSGEVDMAAFEALCDERTKVVSVSHVSNALGTVNPVREMARLGKQRGATVVVDGAQALPHEPVDVQAIGADFYAASGHKVYGPTGIGLLWGRREALESLPPYQGGGDMIRSVTFERTTYNDLPWRFEAGTPNIAGAIGLAAALEYVSQVGIARIADHEHTLLAQATEAVEAMPGVRIIGTAQRKAAVLSFHVEGIHPHDIGSLMDREGIAIRTGHHCAQPVMDRYQLPATNRASFGMYNTSQEVDAFARALKGILEIFR